MVEVLCLNILGILPVDQPHLMGGLPIVVRPQLMLLLQIQHLLHCRAVYEGTTKGGLREEREVRSPRGKGSAVSEGKR
jgi:hypothetical protein